MRKKRSRFVRKLRIRTRWVLARFERLSPLWTDWLPSWGTSLAIHGLLLLMMALIYTQSGQGSDRSGARLESSLGDPLGEEVVSLISADRGGDPFTALESDVPPSLSIETPDPDTSNFAVPDLGSAVRYAPDLAGPSIEPTNLVLPGLTSIEAIRDEGSRPRGRGVETVVMHQEDLSAPFSGRSGVTKAQLLRREGGTAESEKAVQLGLEWLARHQGGDGGWSLDYHGQCSGDGCPLEQPLASDTGATALALLPFLGAGHSHTEEGPYKSVIRRGLTWLVEHQQADGNLFGGGSGQVHLYSHAIATMALCEAYGVSRDKRLRAPAQAAVLYIAAAQNPNDGGWRYTPGMAGDTSVLGWNMMALRSARLAGLNVSKRTLRGCQLYLDLASADPRKMTYSYMPGRRPTPVMTAEALLCRQYLGWPRNYRPLQKAASLVAQDLERSANRNIYYWYYATQMLHNLKGKPWERWNERVRDWLVGTQVGGKGCDRGSWDPLAPTPDRWGRSGGRLYVTALSILTLEVYYRFLPLYAETGGDADLDDPPPADEPGEANPDLGKDDPESARDGAAEVTPRKR